jgi:hypothetical protein
MINKGGGSGKCCCWVLIWDTGEVENYLSFEFAVVVSSMYFRFRRVKTNYWATSMSLGDGLPVLNKE